MMTNTMPMGAGEFDQICEYLRFSNWRVAEWLNMPRVGYRTISSWRLDKKPIPDDVGVRLRKFYVEVREARLKSLTREVIDLLTAGPRPYFDDGQKLPGIEVDDILAVLAWLLSHKAPPLPQAERTALGLAFEGIRKHVQAVPKGSPNDAAT